MSKSYREGVGAGERGPGEGGSKEGRVRTTLGHQH